jgi:hypothetical protein
MKMTRWIGVCIVALISLTGCFDSTPPNDLMRQAITAQVFDCVADFCDVKDFDITNSWSKMGDDNEMHHYFDYTAKFEKHANRDGVMKVALPITWDGKGTVDMVQRGDKWYYFQAPLNH